MPPGTIERGIILRLRFALDQYINLRPFNGNGDLDFVVVRENTEGTYAGEGGFLRKGTPHEIATQGSVNTRMGVERCVRYAFELAQSPAPPPPHARAQDERAHLRRRPVAAHVRRGRRPSTPTSTTAYNHVDAACIYLVEDAGRYDVIVTDNLFGDILTDLAGAVTGGIGLRRHRQPQPRPHRPVDVRAGARLGPRHRRHRPGQPEPPILSAAMMLEFLGETDAAARIRKALADVLASDPVPTAIGDLVAERL